MQRGDATQAFPETKVMTSHDSDLASDRGNSGIETLRLAFIALFRYSDSLTRLVKTGQLHRLISRERRLSYNRAEASVRGTLKRIEVKRWGGEQAHRWVGSLKSLQDLRGVSQAL